LKSLPSVVAEILKGKPKKWAWSWARGAPIILGFPFTISATTEALDFKFDMQLGFAKAHHKNAEEKWAWL